jgi:hypothetical protein
MPFSNYIVYVDESGDHSLEAVDANFPVFALSFCIFEKERYVDTVVPSVQRLKFATFGHDAIILHEREIRKQTGPFAFLQYVPQRTQFMDALNGLVADAPMTIIAAVIHKQRLTQRYVRPSNPYAIALLFCMERLYAFMRDAGATEQTTHIIVERRGKKEDEELELEFRRIADGANMWRCRMDCFELVFVDKKANSSGLQLADLTARPIGLKVVRPTQPNRAYDIIEGKFRRSPTGRVEGWGFKVFP